MNEVAQTTDIMISLYNYTGLVAVDEERKEVTVRAGTTLREVSEALDERGLALITLGAVATRSIAGAISTATHGNGLTVGNMASFVTKLKFVSGKGEVIEVSEDTDPDVFKAAQVSIGMLGVITEVTMQVDDAFNLEEFQSPSTIDDCLDNLEDVVENSGFHVRYWLDVLNNFCLMIRVRRTTEGVTNRPSELTAFVMYYSNAILTRLTFLFPSLSREVIKVATEIGFSTPTYRVDKSYLIFTVFAEIPIHQEGEIVVDYQHTVEAVRVVEEVAQGFPVNYITDVRFVAEDDIWLSPHASPHNGSCTISLNIYAPPEIAKEYLEACFKAIDDAGIKQRYHWAKYFPAVTSSEDIEAMYPMFQKFARIRQSMDPNGIFLNPLLEKTFGF